MWLLNPSLWGNLGHRHICVHFTEGYEGGRWVKRVARTRPNGTAGPEELPLFWTDNRSVVRDANVPVRYLLPAVPRSKGCEAIIVKGERLGELVTVQKYKKKQRKLDVQVNGESRVWEADEDEVCWVEQVTRI
jgi:hypothetical protein